MRAGWILLKIRHKQYGVNVDDVGLDAHIEPLCFYPLSHFVTAPLKNKGSRFIGIAGGIIRQNLSKIKKNAHGENRVRFSYNV